MKDAKAGTSRLIVAYAVWSFTWLGLVTLLLRLAGLSWGPIPIAFFVVASTIILYGLLELPRLPGFSASEAETDDDAESIRRFDLLTRLPGRAGFVQRLDSLIRKAQREEGGLALLLLDLDQFGSVNEELGAPRADRLLIEIGDRLQQAFPEPALIGRIDGDCFAIGMERVAAPREASRLVEQAQEALARGFISEGEMLHLTASMGVCVYPLDGHDAEELIRNADCALSEARTSGTGQHRQYRPGLTEEANERIRLIKELRNAHVHGELTCHFQPRVRLDTGTLVGAEALARWWHEDAWVPPARFIPLAAEGGLAKDLGRWMLWEAAARVSAMQKLGLVPPDFRVSVNLADAQLDAELPRTIREILYASGLPPASLELELSESVVMRTSQSTFPILRQLREMGISVLIDDFGSGRFALTRLYGLPVDGIKIDLSLIQNLDQPVAAGIVRSLVTLGQSLGVEVIAEGIETPAQQEALRGVGCEFGQGYLFGHPLPADDFIRLLHNPPPARHSAVEGTARPALT